MGDHIHRHDCFDCLFLCRSRDGPQPLEDLPPRWGLGHTRCCSSLHVHARVLGRRWQEPNCVQVHRLEHHRPSTDDRVQPHPESRESTDGPAGFWKLLVGTVCMLAFGYAGETKAINPWAGFALGLCGWAFILFEIFAGESAQASGSASDAVKASFNNMRIIVSLGWAIYPAGYFLGQINDSAAAAQALNVTYNIADFVNKIAFVLACWSCAKADSEATKEPLLP